MKRHRLKKTQTEIICPACHGTGFPPVAQPTQPDRKLYPAPCEQCLGKGRISTLAAESSIAPLAPPSSEEPADGASHHDRGVAFEPGFAEPLPRNR
jgi:hypothetical protein